MKRTLLSLAITVCLVGVAKAGDCCAPAVLPPCAPTTCKQCVSITVPTTKVVYSSVCKDYCSCCNLKCLFRHACGEGCQECGKPCTKHVLVKKWVPGCNETKCVVQEVPVPVCGSAMPCAPAKSEAIPVKPVPAK